MPAYVRVGESLPSTQTSKVLKRVLRTELWDCDDVVWWRPGRDDDYRPMTDDDRAAMRQRFRERGRDHLLGRA
jgi:fatty-acyl-CoA synthase